MHSEVKFTFCHLSPLPLSPPAVSPLPSSLLSLSLSLTHTLSHTTNTVFPSSKRLQSNSKSQLHMVFDFIKRRSEEGFAQVQNIGRKRNVCNAYHTSVPITTSPHHYITTSPQTATKTIEGNLLEALKETGDYVKTRQRIDAENLKKLTDGLSLSRARLLSGTYTYTHTLIYSYFHTPMLARFYYYSYHNLSSETFYHRKELPGHLMEIKT